MLRFLFKILFINSIALVLLFAQSTSWKGTTSTAWATSTNWTNGVPTTSLDVVIGDANFTGASQPSITASSTAKSLTIGSASKVSTLTIAHTLTISGSITIGSNGTISQTTTRTSRPITVKGNFVNNGSFTASSSSSRLTFGGTTQSISGTGTTFTARQLYINTGSTTTFKRNITVNSTLNITGTCDPDSTSTPIISGTGTLTLNSGSLLRIRASSFAGNYTISGTKTYSSGSSVEYYSNSTAQSISSTASASTGFRTLKLNGSATKTLTSNITINASNFTLTAGTFDCSTFLMRRSAAGGTFTLSSGTTYRTANTTTNPLDSNFSTSTINSTSTVEYYAASGSQTVRSRTYGRLLLSGGGTRTSQSTAFTVSGNFVMSGAVNFTPLANMTVNGIDSIGSGTTFTAGVLTHTLKSNLVNNGTLTGGTSTITMSGNSSSISGSGTFTFNNLTITGSGVTVSSSTNITMNGNLTTSGSGSLTHSTGGSGTWTMNGSSKTISGTGISFNSLTFGSGASIATTSSLTIAGDLTATGNFSATIGTITLNGTSKTSSGAGTVSVNALNIIGSISCTNSFTMSGDLSVTGSLSASSGTVTFAGTSTFSGTADLFNVTLNGTSLQLGSNADLGIAGAMTLTSGTFDVLTTTPNTVDFNASGGQTVPASTYHNLKFSTGGTKSAAGALTINGDLTIGSGTTFSAGTFAHTLSGDFTNSGSFSAGSSTISLVGSLDAEITGTTTFNTLTVNKSSSLNTVTLNNSISTAALNMTSGSMLTGSNTVTVTSSRNGNGIIIGTITRTHGFSNASAYQFEGPFNTITFSSGAGNVTSITVTTTIGTVNDFSFGSSVNRQYNVTVNGSSYTAAMRLHYEEGELNGNTESGLELWKYSSSWSTQGKTSNDAADNWVELNNLSDIAGRWTLAEFVKVVRWTGAASGDWENASNWTIETGSPSLPPSVTDVVEIGDSAFTNPPTIASSVNVRSIQFGSIQAATVTIASGSLTTTGNIDGSWSTDRTHSIAVGSGSLTVGGNLLLGDGTANHTLNLSLGSGTVTINGSLTQTSSSSIVFSGAGQLNIGVNYNYVSGTFTSSSGTVLYNGTTAQIVAPLTYHDLTINKASSTATLSSSATVTNNLAISSGTFAAQANIVVSGNIAIASGATLSSGSATVSLGGNWSNSGTFTSGTGTINLNGGGSQSIAATTFNNLSINKGSGTATPSANLTVNGNLSVTSGTFDLSSFTSNRSVLGGTLTISSGALLQIGGTNNFPSNFAINTLAASSTLEYNGIGVQTIASVTYGNVTLTNGGSNAKSLSGNTAIAGNFLINSGATFDAGSSSLTLQGNLTDNGTLTASTSTIELSGSSKTINGAITFNNLTISGSYTSANDITVIGNFSNTGSFSTGSTTLTFSGNASNSGSMTNSGTVTFSGTGSQSIALNSGFTSSGSLNFNGTAAPTFSDVSTPNFANVTINNTGGISPSTGWIANGTFTVAVGASFSAGGYSHTFNGTFTNNGTVSSSGTMFFSPSSSVTITLPGTSFSNSGIIEFGGTGAMTIASGVPSLNDVTVSNTNASGITLVSGWTIGGDLTIQSGATLHGGSGISHTIAGNFAVNGTFDGGTSTVIFDNLGNADLSGTGTAAFYHLTIASTDSITASSNITITGDLTNNGTFVNDGIEVTFSGSGNSTIGGSATTFDQLTIAKTSATTTLGVNISELTELVVSSGTLNLSTFSATDNSTDGGTITVNAGAILKIGGSSPTTFDSTNFASTSTVEYTGSSQTVNAAPAYGHLIITASGSTTFSNTAYTIAGDLTVNSGTISAGNATTVSINGNYVQSGGTFSGGTGTAFTIIGNFTLSSGTFGPSSNATTHSIGGNWTMSGGTFTNTNTTIRFNGTGTQTISSTGNFNSITINKSSGALSLSSDITISATLTLTSGNILSNSFKVIIPSTGTVSRTSGHIVGNLQKNVSTGAPARTFEIGDASSYTPLTLSFASVTVAGNLIASSTSGDNPGVLSSGINPNKSVNRYWTLTNSGITFTNFSATFTFVAGDIDVGASTSNFNVSKLTTGTWGVQTAGSRTATSTQATGIAAFGDFQIGESGKVWNGSVDNNWNTAGNWTPSGVPSNVDAVTIGGAFTVNINTAATTADLSIGNASLVLTVLSGNSLTVSGNLSLSSGTLNTASSFPTVSGTTTISGGTVGYTGTSAQSIAKLNYYHLTLSGVRTTNNVTFPTDTVGIAGTFINSASFTSGGFVTTSNTIRYNGNGGQTVIPFSYNNLLLTGVHSDSIKFDSSSTIKIAGTFSAAATFTSGTYSTTGSTIEFNGNGAQTIPAFQYYNLTLSGARGGNGLTFANSDTIHIAKTFDPSASGTSYTQTGTIFDFNGTTAQLLPAFTYNSLVFSNAGTKSISSSITSSNNFINRAASTLSIGNVTVQVNGILNNAGTIINDGIIQTGN